ncbi:hypothetical protein B0H11DRAFT_2290966 [Mycena galericulata]|nr:hypothetical protein B0H11DRAFT_2290966 [Mycena galericulata]
MYKRAAAALPVFYRPPMFNPHRELTEEEYRPIKKQIKDYISEIQKNEADYSLQQEAIKNLTEFLRGLHHTESRVKVWVYGFMDRQVAAFTNEKLDRLWNAYKAESQARKSLAAANPRRSRTKYVHLPKDTIFSVFDFFLLSRPLPEANLSSLLEGPSAPSRGTGSTFYIPDSSHSGSSVSVSSTRSRGRHGRPFSAESGVFDFQSDSSRHQQRTAQLQQA